MIRKNKKNKAKNCENWDVLNIQQERIRKGKPFEEIRYWNSSDSVKLFENIKHSNKNSKCINRWFLVKFFYLME